MGMYTDIVVLKSFYPNNDKSIEELEEFVEEELMEAELHESKFFYEFTVRKFGYGGYKHKEKLAEFLHKIAERELYYEIKVLTRYENHRDFLEWDWKEDIQDNHEEVMQG